MSKKNKFKLVIEPENIEKTNALAETAGLLAAFQTRLDGVDNNASYALDLLQGQQRTNEKTTTSLYELRDSTAKAFENVTVDIKNLLHAIQRLNERVSKLESREDAGYRRADELDERIKKIEGQLTPVWYHGYEATYRGDVLRVAGGEYTDSFKLPEEIVKLESTQWGLQITVKSGAQYLLSGGPTPASMFLNFLRSGPGNSAVNGLGTQEDED